MYKKSLQLLHSPFLPAHLAIFSSILQSSPLNQERQAQRTRHAQPHDRPPRHNNLFIAKLAAHIPYYMSEPIEAVKRERQRKERLGPNLRSDWPTRKRGCDTRGLEVPAQ